MKPRGRAARLPGNVTDAAGKQEAILDAAASVFMELGFIGSSLDDISDALGATKGIIYYYFRNKSALFFAVQRRAMDLTRATLEPIANSALAPADKLRAMAHAHTLLTMRHLPYLRVAGQGLELHLSGRTSAAEREEMRAITDLRDGNERLYIGVLEAGIASGAFRATNARLMSKPLLGALNWTSRWYQPRAGETDADREGIARQLADFVTHALIAVPGPKAPILRAVPAAPLPISRISKSDRSRR